MVKAPELLKHTETLPCPEGCDHGRVTEVREYRRDEATDRTVVTLVEINCGRCGGTGKVTKGVHIEETAPS